MSRILSQAAARVGHRAEKPMLAAGKVLLDASAELVPMDTKALYESRRLRQEGSGLNTVIIVGYGAVDYGPISDFSPHEQRVVVRYPYAYAVYVHEDYTRSYIQDINPNAQPGFLEKPLYTKKPEMRAAFRAAL